MATLGTLFLAPAARPDTIQDPLAGKKRRGAEATPSTKPGLPPEKRVRFVESWRVPLGSPLAGPLLALEDRVVATVEGGTVQAVSLGDGGSLWKADLGATPAGGAVQAAGLIVQAAVSGKLLALDPAGGSPRWSLELDRAIRRQPTPTSTGVFVPLEPGQVVSVDLEGRERWRADLKGEPSVPVAACRGMVLVGTEAGTVEAFERTTGRRLWESQIGSPVRSPFLCRRDRIYFSTADNRLRVLRYSGRRSWSYPVGGSITAVPFFLDARVYFFSYDDYIYALKARSGDLLLRVRMSHRLADEPAIGPDKLYLSPYTSARLVALTLPDLQLAGEYALDLEGEWFTTPPISSGHGIVIGYGRYEGRILALKEEKESSAPSASGSPAP
jgi:outer membrane protein assembly factor BamB